MSADFVLLIAFGGPERPEDIRPFLEIVTAGRRIPLARLDEVAHHYELIGGRSPLNELTRRQASALAAALAGRGIALPVTVGMRNWRPLLKDALAEMRDRGLRRGLGIILSSLQTEASWERYVADVARARDALGAEAPEVAFTPPWADHPLYTEVMADRVSEALALVPAERRAAAHLVFTAHSVPVAMAAGSPYAEQLVAAASRIAGRLGRAEWSVAYQSRSGPPNEPWLEPDIGDRLRALRAEGARDAVVVPVGFVSDHVEVLYDLDVEARGISEEIGLGFHRALAANDHPKFVELLAELVAAGPARS